MRRNEKWLSIPGYENVYEVSDNGRVRNSKGVVLKALVAKNGRLSVSLFKPGHRWQAPIHRLVLLAFVGPPPLGMEARHYPDRDPANNHLANLSWATRKVNHHDKIKHGTDQSGERQGLAVLTLEAVRKIRTIKASQSDLAKMFGVHQSTVSRVLGGKSWSRWL